MSAALAFLAGRAPLFLALGVFAGLFLPGLATAARTLLEPGVVALMTVSLLRLDWPAFGRSLRAPAAAVAALWLLVLTAGVSGPDVGPYVAMAQLPIYLLPALGAPIYRRLGV